MMRDIQSFSFQPGRRLAGKYIVGDLLGKGWEGEVYHVTEIDTKIERAAKFFYPKRNPRDRALRIYAQKLNRLRDCAIVIQYHTRESFQYCRNTISFLVSEYVDGELLTDFLARQKGKRLSPFEAMHLLYTLADGVEEIHNLGEYHGDLHTENIIVKREGIEFKVKLVDMYYWGRRTAAHVHDDVCDLIRLFYDAVGGCKRYSAQPPEVKSICCGLKRSLIKKKFRSAGHLRAYLETMPWD